MNKPKPEWYTHLKEDSFQGKPFNIEKVRKVEQRVAEWTAEADKRERKNKWKIGSFSLAICLGVLVFSVLFNRGGADWLKAKVQTTMEITQTAEPVASAVPDANAELVPLTESEDKRIAVYGELDPADSGMFNSITVRIDDKTKRFAWKSTSFSSFYPEATLTSFDGTDERVIIILTTAHGTGLSKKEAHVLNMDFSEIKVADPFEELKRFVQTKTLVNSAEKHQYSITVAGIEHLFEYAGADDDTWFDKVYFGNIIDYYVEDHTLMAEAPAQVSLGNFPGHVKMTYALEAGALRVAAIKWIDEKAPTPIPEAKPSTIPIRAAGKTTFGDLQIVSKSKETIEALGAPSCLGIAKDFSIKGDYQVLFKNSQGIESVVAPNEMKHIIYPNQETIPMNKLSFKEFDSLSFIPTYTDCHGIQFYLYGVTAKGAFQFEFQTNEDTTDSYYMEPTSKLQVINDQLIVVGGRAAGDVGYALRYIFKPDLAAKTMVLVKTEKVIDKG
ncbi:hypothetical protein EHS13_01850 [Paenibacillus psychroresistens]|uniref:Uncharacterized protein n=1 Tax=Paenibacillus psychroresistens TaxID=1778678 RepID=A0A6B8RCJ4_9BACL|nr:hypothetical protein [Paenibacillus psychroresistens]QGQ93737.1 hypothetical protein EHS13_01850 [Paenibacillus psychroresistens]